MNRLGAAATGALALLASPADAVEVPPAGSCPAYASQATQGARETPEDVEPALLRSGERIGMKQIARLKSFLPPEVWQRRATFFYAGMELEVGPCHRRYPAAPYFREATAAHAGEASLDAEGNLLGFAGTGLPFAPERIDEEASDAAARWAWNYRYRYLGAGFRGDFRIRHVSRRGRKIERFEGDFFLLPLRGVPGLDSREDGDRAFVAGGRFRKPEVARGLAWRQFRSAESDRESRRADDVFVWLPDDRRVRRSASALTEGLYLPSYTRAQSIGNEILSLPDGQVSGLSAGVGATEPMRKGFVGLVIRPNAYAWRIERVQDVLAPLNVAGSGFPVDADRSFGPSGLSVANDRWDLRRAVVLAGESRRGSGYIGSIQLWVDALTLHPLYLITRRPNSAIAEVGIFVGRYSGDDPSAAAWQGSSSDFGAILPVAQTFFVAGDEGWMRESFELRFDPPDAGTYRLLLSTVRLQRGH